MAQLGAEACGYLGDSAVNVVSWGDTATPRMLPSGLADFVWFDMRMFRWMLSVGGHVYGGFRLEPASAQL